MSIGYKASKQSAGKRLSTSLSTWTAVDAGGGTLPTGGSYTRPSDWLALPDVGTTQQFVGLYAIFPNANYAAILCQGNYTVDWGDGTITNHASGTTAEYSYNYANISNSTLCSRGYKQVIIKVTPQAGYNLTAITVNKGHSTLAFGGSTGWLDISLYTPYLVDFFAGYMGARATNNNVFRANMLEIVDLRKSAIVDSSYMFYEMPSLSLIKTLDMSSSAAEYMFYKTPKLSSVPTITVTNNISKLQYMFYQSGISSVTFSTTSLSNCRIIDYMFYGCVNLKTHPAFNFSYTYSAKYLFAQCTSLVSVPGLSFGGLWYNPQDGNSYQYLDYLYYGCTNLLKITSNIGTSASAGLVRLNSAFSESGIIEVPVMNAISNKYLIGGTYDSCRNLTTAYNGLSGATSSISIQYCKLSGTELNNLYSYIGNANQTINVTGNFGTASDTPSIATNKGWTVFG